MSRLEELRQLIRQMIVKEISTSGGSGIGGSAGALIQTPMAFTGGTKRGEAKRKKIANVLGMKPAPAKRELREGRLFEDVINKVGFDIKFSDQAKELMDYIHSNEKFEDDLQDIQTLFDKMQQDGVFSKEEAFKVYKEFVERAAREYMRDTNQDISVDEFFLRKDLLDVIYYHLSKLEMPQSGRPNDNIDQKPGEEPAGAAPAPPEGGEAGAPPAGGEAPAAGREAGAAPAGGEAPPPPEGGETPAGEEAPAPEGEEGPPKPEEVAEVHKLVGQIINEITSGEIKIDELEEIRSYVRRAAKKYATSGEHEFAKELVKIMQQLDSLEDKYAMGAKIK